jgi:hypothetical protein
MDGASGCTVYDYGTAGGDPFGTISLSLSHIHLSPTYISLSHIHLSLSPTYISLPHTSLSHTAAILFQAMQQSDVLQKARLVRVDIAVPDVVAPKSKFLREASQLVMPSLGFCKAVTHRVHGMSAVNCMRLFLLSTLLSIARLHIDPTTAHIPLLTPSLHRMFKTAG